MENKVSKELAEKELFELLDSFDVDTNVSEMLEEDANDFKNLTNAMLRPMLSGKAVIDGDEYHLTLKQPLGETKVIKVTEPNGVAWELMDRAKKGEDIKRLMRFIEGFTGVPYAQIRTMKNADLTVLKSFAQLFLA